MSVVDLIRNREVCAILDPLVDAIPRRRTLRVSLLVPASERHKASLVGTAFDYAIRFMLQRQNPSAITGRWVAEHSADALHDDYSGKFGDKPPRWASFYVTVARRAALRVRNARIFLRKHLKRRVIDDSWLERLATYALKLARLDPYYRAAYFDESLVANDGPALIAELVALVRLAPLPSLTDASLWLNPTFGRFSDVVRGADADIIAGNRLIELKTRMRPYIERHDMRQLLVYCMLADLARTDGLQLPEIKVIQIYVARHGELVSYDLEPVRRLVHYKNARRFIIEHAERLYQGRIAERAGLPSDE